MFAQKTKLQLCAKNLTGVEHDLVDVTYPSDLVGAVNDASPPVIGDTVVTVDGFGGGDIPTGCIIGFAGDDTTYYVSTGASSTSITIDPPLRTNLANDQVVTIYPHFDITTYWTNDVEIGLQAEFTQAELIFDRPIKIELFNQNSIFYDRDTHSTGWTAATAYFSTYNAQADTDNQYIRISLKRNGTWYQKYNGKIIQHTLELDEINHSVSFECESVFYGLKDRRLFEVPHIYENHKYASPTRKTQTISGKYVDIGKRIFQDPKIGIAPKSHTVTAKYASGHTRTITLSAAHTVQPGELFTVDITDSLYDGTHLADSVTSDTVTWTKKDWFYDNGETNNAATAGDSEIINSSGGSDIFGDTETGEISSSLYKIKFANHDTIYTFYRKGEDFRTIKLISPSTLTSNVPSGTKFIVSYPSPEHTEATATSAVNNGAGYGIGVTDITVDALTPTSIFATDGYSPTAQMMCKFSGHATVYAMSSTANRTTIKVVGGLTSAVIDNEAVSVYYPTPAVSTTGLSVANGLTQHRIIFDTASKYLDHSHQNWDYDLLDCWYIVQKWMKKTIEEDVSFSFIKDFCVKFGAVACIDYVYGVAYAFVRSKINESSSKVTLTSSKIIGKPRLLANWQFISTGGVPVSSDIEYFDLSSLASVSKYDENNTPTQSFTSKVHVAGDTTIYTDGALPTVGNYVIIGSDSTKYRVESTSSGLFTISPELTADSKENTPFYEYADLSLSIIYGNTFNIKLKHPDIWVGGERLYKFYNNGDFPSIVNYALRQSTQDTNSYYFESVSVVPLIPIGRGYSIPSSKSVICGIGNSFTGIGYIKQFSMAGEENKILTILAGGGATDLWRSSFGIARYFNPDTGTKEIVLAGGFSGESSLYLYKIYVGLTDSGTSNVKTAKVNGAEIIGATSIDYTDETATILQGDYCVFSGHSSVYEITARTSSNLTIAPGLTSAISDKETILVKGIDFSFAKLTNTGTLFSGADVTGIGWSGCFINSDILNPEYDDLIYYTIDGTRIRRTDMSSLEYGFLVVSATLATRAGESLKGLHIQAGESTYAPLYYCDVTGDQIMISDDASMTTYTSLCGGGATSPSLTLRTNDLALSNPNGVRKCYDNMVLIADTGNDKVILYDVDSGYAYCVLDSTLIATPHSVHEDEFIQVLDFDNGSNRHWVDINFNASKLAYKFYSKNRRPYECQVRDEDLGYIDYTLFDRMTIDSGILSAASGSPKFYVYGYSIDCRTHEHKLTLLESVE